MFVASACICVRFRSAGDIDIDIETLREVHPTNVSGLALQT